MRVVSERPIQPNEQIEFENYAREGIRILGASASDDPGSLVAAVDSYVDRYQRRKQSFLGKLLAKKPNHIELSLALGIVWANQVVRELNWEWTCVTNDGHDYYVVTNVDRSLTIYATYFIKECLDYATADCTALLSFNMLKAGSFPSQAAKSYTSVMPAVRRLVSKSAVRGSDG